MMSKKKVIVTLLLALRCSAFAASDEWHLFRSSAGFSVAYPGTWVRHGASTDRLQVLSSKGGAEGIGIKQGQAEITVMEAPESAKQALAQVIAYYTQDTMVLSQKDVPGEPVPKSCSNLKESDIQGIGHAAGRLSDLVCRRSSTQTFSVKLTGTRS